MLNPYPSPWEPSPPKKAPPPRVMDALARGMLEGVLLGGACGGTAAGVLSAAWEVMHPNPTPGLPLFVVGSMFAGVIGAMAGLVIGPAVVVLRKIWLSDRRELVMLIAAAVCGMVGAVLGLMEGGLLSMGESEPEHGLATFRRPHRRPVRNPRRCDPGLSTFSIARFTCALTNWARVLEYFPLDPNNSYYEQQKTLGLSLDRLYK